MKYRDANAKDLLRLRRNSVNPSVSASIHLLPTHNKLVSIPESRVLQARVDVQDDPSASRLGYVGISSVSYQGYPETELMST